MYTVRQLRRHVNPGAGVCLDAVISHCDIRLALDKVEHGWMRRRVLFEFLSGLEREDEHLYMIVREDSSSLDMIGRMTGFHKLLDMIREVVDVGVVH